MTARRAIAVDRDPPIGGLPDAALSTDSRTASHAKSVPILEGVSSHCPGWADRRGEDMQASEPPARSSVPPGHHEHTSRRRLRLQGPQGNGRNHWNILPPLSTVSSSAKLCRIMTPVCCPFSLEHTATPTEALRRAYSDAAKSLKGADAGKFLDRRRQAHRRRPARLTWDPVGCMGPRP